MVFHYLLEGQFNLSVHVKAKLVDETVQSCSIELGLDFRKYTLNWIKLRRVCHIFYPFYAELSTNLFNFFRSMDCELVHKECNLSASIQLLVQSLQVVNEVIRSYSLGVHSGEADTLL